MNSTKLLLSTSYYIRKLLLIYGSQLESVVCPGAGLIANSATDLNQVIASLYLEEKEIQSMRLELEDLVQAHRKGDISTKEHLGKQKLKDLESRIFWILGFRRIDSQRNLSDTTYKDSGLSWIL